MDAGRLRVVAYSMDGVIEAIDDPIRPFYVGVQWHPSSGGNGFFNLDLDQTIRRAHPLDNVRLHRNLWTVGDIMFIKVGYELIYDCPPPMPMLFMLNIHYSHADEIVKPDSAGHDPP